MLFDRTRDYLKTNPPATEAGKRENNIEIARRIWVEARGARGTPVGQYLAAHGIDIELPRVLRWNPRCWHREVRAELPAMVALVDAVDGSLIGVHRTYLRRDDRGQWYRRDRASLGPIAAGAVRLAPAAKMMMAGKGIETCLAAMQATALPA